MTSHGRHNERTGMSALNIVNDCLRDDIHTADTAGTCRNGNTHTGLYLPGNLFSFQLTQ